MKKIIVAVLVCGVMVLGLTGCNNKDSKLKENDNSQKSSYVIIDEVAEKQLSCDEEIERFYEDEFYAYYWSCIKNEHMIVKYENGTTKLVSEALKDGSITLSDLDKNNISYIKEPIREIVINDETN